jgi:hypothetical protein
LPLETILTPALQSLKAALGYFDLDVTGLPAFVIDREQDNFLMVRHGRHQLVETIHSLHRMII